MILHKPFKISARLLPCVEIGGAFIQLEYACKPSGGRVDYRWTIDLGKKSFSGEDLHSGLQGGSLQEGFGSLLSFLGAFAESIQQTLLAKRPGENSHLFPKGLARWASQHSDEISSVQMEIEEAQEPLIEE